MSMTMRMNISLFWKARYESPTVTRSWTLRRGRLRPSARASRAWCNLSDTPARVLVVLSPDDVEGLFKEVVARKGNDIAAILNKYGCRSVGPPLLESVHTFESSPS